MLANKMKIKDLEMQKKIENQKNYNNKSPGSKNSDRSAQSKNNDLINIISGNTYLHNGTILGPGRFGVKHDPHNLDIQTSIELVEGLAFKDGEIAIDGVTVEDL